MKKRNFIDVGKPVKSQIRYPYLEAIPKEAFSTPVVLGLSPKYITPDDVDVYLVTAKDTKTLLTNATADIRIDAFIYRIPETKLKISAYIYASNEDVFGELIIPTEADPIHNPSGYWLDVDFRLADIFPDNYTRLYGYKKGVDFSTTQFKLYKYDTSLEQNIQVIYPTQATTIVVNGYEDLKEGGSHRYDVIDFTTPTPDGELTLSVYATPRYKSTKLAVDAQTADPKPWTEEGINALSRVEFAKWFHVVFVDYENNETATTKWPSIAGGPTAVTFDDNDNVIIKYNTNDAPYTTTVAAYSGQKHEESMLPLT